MSQGTARGPGEQVAGGRTAEYGGMGQAYQGAGAHAGADQRGLGATWGQPYPVAPPAFRFGIRHILALVGSVILLASLLCPIETRGNEYINYWNTGEGKAVLLLALLCIVVTFVSGVGTLPRWAIMGVWAGAGLALVLTIYNLIDVQSKIPSDVSLGWGWIIAILGAVVVGVAPLLPDKI